eukprot:TRINITY_DN2345_c0_g1_i1.p1 TRINITY_DN2345_c0_g1~~TRINITY_DN2345_c0_g1_i1.p1  ORF type:complete len:911 (+),score=222.37 TRINITY_DN2345_c0_g1_i1:86-2734(+)
MMDPDPSKRPTIDSILRSPKTVHYLLNDDCQEKFNRLCEQIGLENCVNSIIRGRERRGRENDIRSEMQIYLEKRTHQQSSTPSISRRRPRNSGPDSAGQSEHIIKKKPFSLLHNPFGSHSSGAATDSRSHNNYNKGTDLFGSRPDPIKPNGRPLGRPKLPPGSAPRLRPNRPRVTFSDEIELRKPAFLTSKPTNLAKKPIIPNTPGRKPAHKLTMGSSSNVEVPMDVSESPVKRNPRGRRVHSNSFSDFVPTSLFAASSRPATRKMSLKHPPLVPMMSPVPTRRTEETNRDHPFKQSSGAMLNLTSYNIADDANNTLSGSKNSPLFGDETSSTSKSVFPDFQLSLQSGNSGSPFMNPGVVQSAAPILETRTPLAEPFHFGSPKITPNDALPMGSLGASEDGISPLNDFISENDDMMSLSSMSRTSRTSTPLELIHKSRGQTHGAVFSTPPEEAQTQSIASPSVKPRKNSSSFFVDSPFKNSSHSLHSPTPPLGRSITKPTPLKLSPLESDNHLSPFGNNGSGSVPTTPTNISPINLSTPEKRKPSLNNSNISNQVPNSARSVYGSGNTPAKLNISTSSPGGTPLSAFSGSFSDVNSTLRTPTKQSPPIHDMSTPPKSPVQSRKSVFSEFPSAFSTVKKKSSIPFSSGNSAFSSAKPLNRHTNSIFSSPSNSAFKPSTNSVFSINRSRNNNNNNSNNNNNRNGSLSPPNEPAVAISPHNIGGNLTFKSFMGNNKKNNSFKNDNKNNNGGNVPNFTNLNLTPRNNKNSNFPNPPTPMDSDWPENVVSRRTIKSPPGTSIYRPVRFSSEQPMDIDQSHIRIQDNGINNMDTDDYSDSDEGMCPLEPMDMDMDTDMDGDFQDLRLMNDEMLRDFSREKGFSLEDVR